MNIPPKALANLRTLEAAVKDADRRYRQYAAGVMGGMGMDPKEVRLDLEKGEATPIPQNGQPEREHA